MISTQQRSLAVVLTGAALLLGGCRPAGPERTEILWDTWGVPHIYGKSQEELFHAFGWAQAQSHGDLILRLYGQARARGAEYWGEDYLDTDRWLISVGVPERARRWYASQNRGFRRNLDAFAAGFNAYAAEHRDQISDEVEVVLPVDATDVLAHFQHTILFSFVAQPWMIGALERTWQPAGSNAWAIAPSRSASGNAMLLANPHLPWSDLYVWYEAQLIAPGVDAYGATLVGLPVPAVAFNDHLGWTHTVNTHDGADFYELTLSAGGYRWDGGVQPFETEEHTLRVKQANGEPREETVQVRRSIHGPVVTERQDAALALRMVGLDRPGMVQAWWDMCRATNLREFEAVLERMDLPMFTVIYADREGHIVHLFAGLTPVRPEGEWNWSGIVPGDTSATLWTQMHPYEDLPRVLDPESGWLQNANDPPWTTTFPRALNPDDYPEYMAPRFMHFRAQRSARMLSQDESVTFDELVLYKHSTHVELADHILDDVIAAARAQGGALARQAADVLERWDRKTDADSRGAVLFIDFVEELMGRFGARAFAVAWSPESPLDTPDGLADHAAAAAALERAAVRVDSAYGALDVPYGDVYRLRGGGLDLPGNGGRDNFGIFRAAWYAPAEGEGFQAFGGDSYVAAIEFSDPVKAMAVLGYGNASQPGSPHLMDQLELVARKELRPVWRTREEIEVHLESRKVFE
jgi:acyl-homoserine-lactone acylase